MLQRFSRTLRRLLRPAPTTRSAPLLHLALVGAVALVACGAGSLPGTLEPRPLPNVPLYGWVFQPKHTVDGKIRPLTAEEVGSLDADVMAFGIKTGTPVNVRWTREFRELIARSRQLAAARGRKMRFFVEIRPDHYRELDGFKTVPGWRDEWLMKIPRERYEYDANRFRSAGWELSFEHWIAASFWNRIRPPDSPTAPAYYGSRAGLALTDKDRVFRIHGALTDMRVAAYRAWHVAWAKALIDFVGADGASVAVKTGWLAYPTYAPLAGPGLRNGGGPLSPTPYGPGEFEASMGAYLMELAATGTLIVVTERPAGKYGLGAWYPPAVRKVLLGEIDFLDYTGKR